MKVGEAFSAHASIYDRSRRQLIPCFDDYYGSAVAQAPFPSDAALRVFDLGAGTGLMSSCFATAFPNARFTLVDVAPEMLTKVRERFAGDPRFEYIEADYMRWPFEGTFDLIVSCLSIHHLEDADKRTLFRHASSALRRGGAFINADEVCGTTDAVTARNTELWLAQARAAGGSEEDIAASRERMKFDRLATVEQQLAWIRDAGLRDVDCVYKYLMFAVMCGFA